MKKQKIKVTKIEVSQTDPQTDVYQVEIVADDNKGAWNETFNTPELLHAFLRGLRVATAMLGETFAMKDYWEFHPDSCIHELP
jgi:hypothetical protein